MLPRQPEETRGVVLTFRRRSHVVYATLALGGEACEEFRFDPAKRGIRAKGADDGP